MTVERLAVFNMVSVGRAAEALADGTSPGPCVGAWAQGGCAPSCVHAPANAQRRAPRPVIASVVASVVASVRPVSAEGRSRRARARASASRAGCWAGGSASPPASRASGRTPRPRAAAARRVAPRRAPTKFLEQISLCAFVHIADTYCTYGRSIFSQWHLHWRMTDGRRCQTQQLSVHYFTGYPSEEERGERNETGARSLPWNALKPLRCLPRNPSKLASTLATNFRRTSPTYHSRRLALFPSSNLFLFLRGAWPRLR